MLNRVYFVASALAHPYTFVATAYLLLTLWPRRAPARRARSLTTLVLALALYALSSPVVSRWMTASLEAIHPYRPDAAVGHVEAIVVLSGGFRLGPDGRGELAYDTMSRCVRAADLYRAIGPRPIVVSGGILATGPTTVPVARGMGRFLSGVGIPSADIVEEATSTTTYENARESARLARTRGWQRIALVTSATHLPRAVAAFEGQGLQVEAVGANYTTPQASFRVIDLLPSATSVDSINRAAHEWIGFAWYQLRGYVGPAAPREAKGTSDSTRASDRMVPSR